MASTTLAFDLIGRDVSAGRTFDRVGGKVDRLGDKFRKVARVASRLAAGAGVALGTGLVVAAKAAASEEKEMAILAGTLRKSTGANDKQIKSTESWITTMQNATGIADGDLRPALGKLAIATGSNKKAQDLLARAMDISVARGKPLGTVVESLGKGAIGTTGGLGRLGLATKDASGKALTFDQILQNANKTMGGAAELAGKTTAGQFDILRARFADLTEEVGARLLPYMNRLLTWFLDKGIPAIAKFGGWIRDDLVPALKDFGTQVWDGIKDSVEQFRAGIGMAGEDGASAGDKFGAFSDFITKKLIPAFGKFIKTTLPAYARAIGEIIGLAFDLSEAWLSMASTAIGAFRSLTVTALNALGGILTAVDKVRFLFPALSGKIDEAAQGFDDFRDRTVGAFDKAKEKVDGLRDALGALRNKTLTVTIKTRGEIPAGMSVRSLDDGAGSRASGGAAPQVVVPAPRRTGDPALTSLQNIERHVARRNRPDPMSAGWAAY